MHTPTHPLTSILFLAFLPHLSYSVTYPDFNGYQVQDLGSTTTDLFNLEAQTWTSSGLVSSTTTSTCGGYPLLGGFQILSYDGYFEKEYTSLPSHTMIYYQVQFFVIDSWDYTDTIELDFNGTTIVTGGSPGTYSLSFPSNVCGQSNNDLPWFTMVGQVLHNTDSLTLRITSKVNQSPSVASFGIQSVSLIFASPTPLASESSCYHISDSIYLNGLSGECMCPRGRYGSLCASCDASCADCFGGSSSECYVCNTGYSFTGTSCVQCDSTCTTCSGPNANQCITCAGSKWLQADGTCQDTCSLSTRYQIQVDDFKMCKFPCDTSQYAVWDETCSSNCTYPLQEVTVGTDLFCDKPCSSGFFDWNDTCVSTCTSPLVQYVELGVDRCAKPCNGTDYLDWNSNCVTTCTSPLVPSTEQNISLCTKPCNGTDFLDWNNACIATCISPLVQYSEQSVDRCKKPCTGTDFFNWDNTCVATCPSPLVQDTLQGVSVCNKPCSDGQFLDWNNNCISSCTLPLLQSSNQGVNLCNLPCPNQYLYPNYTCITDCSSPYVTRTENSVQYCDYPCDFDANEFITLDDSCVTGCDTTKIRIDGNLRYCNVNSKTEKQIADINNTLTTTGKIASIGATAMAFASTSSPTALSLASLVKMLLYIRYLNIEYPEKVEKILDRESASIEITFGPKMSKDFEEEFPDHPLPGKFDKYEVKSSFFVNFWEALSTLLIIGAIIIVAMIVSRLTKRYKYVHAVSNKIKNITKWDLFLIMFCSNYDGVALYTSLELRTIQFESFAEVVSFLVCLAANIATIFLLVKLVFILIEIRKSKSTLIHPSHSVKGYTPPAQRWRSYRMLFENFKDESILQQAFMFFFLFRIYLFDTIIGNLFDHPMVQTTLILIMSMLMLSYLIVKRPFKHKYDLGEFIMNEFILLIVNLNTFILAILDRTNPDDENTRNNCGEIIIICNIVFNVLAVVILAIEIVMKLYEAYQIYKTKKGKDKWLEMFLLYFEKDGLEVKDRHATEEPEEPETLFKICLSQDANPPDVSPIEHCSPNKKSSYQALNQVEESQTNGNIKSGTSMEIVIPTSNAQLLPKETILTDSPSTKGDIKPLIKRLSVLNRQDNDSDSIDTTDDMDTKKILESSHASTASRKESNLLNSFVRQGSSPFLLSRKSQFKIQETPVHVDSPVYQENVDEIAQQESDEETPPLPKILKHSKSEKELSVQPKTLRIPTNNFFKEVLEDKPVSSIVRKSFKVSHKTLSEIAQRRKERLETIKVPELPEDPKETLTDIKVEDEDFDKKPSKE